MTDAHIAIPEPPLSRRDAQWMDMYDRVVAYIRTTGKWPSQAVVDKAGKQIGCWVNQQRILARRGTLVPWRLRLLNAHSFEMRRRPPGDTAFEEKVRLLAETWREKPNAWPYLPKPMENRESIKLWMHRVRKEWERGTLSESRYQKLKAINFPFSAAERKRARERTFEATLSRLTEFVRREGRYPRVTSPSPHERKLATWWKNRHKRVSKGDTEYRKRLLREAAPAEGARMGQWLEHFDQIREHKERHGRWPSAGSKVESEVYLSKWATRQRKKYGAGKLNPEQKRLVEKIGLHLPPTEPQWRERFEQLREFVGTHERFPGKHTDDEVEKSLYYWRADQLHLRSIARLIPSRGKMLEEAGLMESQYGLFWQRTARRLGEFMHRHGRLPRADCDDETERRLGEWRQRQYGAYMNHALPDERVRQLGELGVLRTALDEQWEVQFAKLERFVRTAARLPSVRAASAEETSLAKWRSRQRELMMAGELDEGRCERLRSIRGEETLYERKWDRSFRSYKRFVEKRKRHPRTGARTTEERSLAVWAVRQRSELRRGKLEGKREMALSELGIFGTRKMELWYARYGAVYRFAKENGALPHRRAIDPAERSLARWIEHQRARMCAGKLTKAQLSVFSVLNIRPIDKPAAPDWGTVFSL